MLESFAVTAPRKLQTWREQVDESIVTTLTNALDMARKGEFSSIVVLGNVRGSTEMRFLSAKCENRVELIGALFHYAQCVSEKMRRGADDL